VPNPVFCFLDGRTYTLHGISGVFKHEVRQVRYPCARTEERLTFHPDEEGQGTKQYRIVRRELGDNWSTDLTDAIETYCDIATELGYREE
jgi:hypothetical protein